MKKAVKHKTQDHFFDPVTRRTLPNGTEVEVSDFYWARAIRDGDVVILPPKPVEVKPVEVKPEPVKPAQS
jgi:hypothetical protein